MTQTIGSRRQVWNGTAKKTSGGLTKSDLMMSHGRIVSKSKHFSAKKEMRLLKHGYGTKKGKFGFVRIGTKKSHKKNKKMRGGHVGITMGLYPSGVDGEYITNYNNAGSIGVQEEAGMAGGDIDVDEIGNDFDEIGNEFDENSPLSGGRHRRRHRTRRRMRGGSGMRTMSEPGLSNWNGDGIAGAGITVGNAGSANLQLLAGMAGGRRRRHKNKKMRGGTTSHRFPLSPGSVGVQMEAGLGN